MLGQSVAFPGSTSKSQAANTVLHLNDKQDPVCKKCAPGHVVLKASPDFILHHYKEGLPAMGFTEFQISAFDGQNTRGLLSAFD
jgi:hypothetical protein